MEVMLSYKMSDFLKMSRYLTQEIVLFPLKWSVTISSVFGIHKFTVLSCSNSWINVWTEYADTEL
jgi:hypothetical protein